MLSVAGIGGMGTVFKARQIDLDRFVAVKVIQPEQASDTESSKRFEREARAISCLSHCHIAAFLAYGVLENRLQYIVMEWLEGESLLALLRRTGLLPLERALKIAIQITEALEYAHNAKIIHRDLKPDNIILLDTPTPDYVKIVDFGLARTTIVLDAESQNLTATGILLGTPQFMSPEQCKGSKADARSDIYALGCILYTMLCGAAPFESDSPIGLIHMHISNQPKPLSSRRKDLDRHSEFIAHKCLQKDPARRYQSMKDLQTDLEACLLGAHPIGDQLKLSSSGSHKLARVFLLALPLIAFGAYFCFQWLNSSSGVLSAILFKLNKDRNAVTIAHCLKESEKLTTNNASAFREIENAITKVAGEASIDDLEIARAYFGTAKDLQAQNQNNLAFEYFSAGLKRVYKRGVKPGYEHSTEVLDAMERGSSIALATQHRLTKAQLDMELELLMRDNYSMPVFVRQNTLELFSKECLQSPRKLSPEELDRIADYAYILSRKGRVKELDNLLQKFRAKIDQYPAGEPLYARSNLPNIYGGIVLEMAQSRKLDEMERYLALARKLIEERKGQLSPQDEQGLAVGCSHIAEAYNYCGKTEKALYWANKSLTYQKIREAYKASCSYQKICALRNQGKSLEAETLARKALNSIEIDSTDLDLCATKARLCSALFQTMIQNGKTEKAAAFMESTLINFDKHNLIIFKSANDRHDFIAN